MNLHALGEHPPPQGADLLTLANTVGRYESGPNSRVWRHIARGLHVPSGDEIQQPRIVDTGEDSARIFALRVVHILGTDKRWIAQQVSASLRRQDIPPVQLQGVAMHDRRA